MPHPTLLSPSLIVLILLVCFGAVLVRLLSGNRPRSTEATYRRKPLLTAWEKSALAAMNAQLPPGLYLCPQVRLADMLTITAPDRLAYLRGLNRVAAKSVDFAVVEVATGLPLLVVELDDKSHGREDRQTRDALVNDVLRQAGIPIARFRPRQRLDIRPHLAALVPISPGQAAAE